MREIRESTIVPRLGSYDEDEQRWASAKVREALDRAPAGTAEILAATLDDPVAEDRTKVLCAYLLSTVQDPRGIPTLLEHVGTTNEAASDLVLSGLINYGSDAVPHAIHILETGDDVARSAAASLLIDLRSPAGYDALWRRLEHERNAEIRFLLVCGIADDDRPLAIDRLLSALDDTDELVREPAWNALRVRADVPEALVFEPAGDASVRRVQVAKIDAWLHRR
ncbi:MAG: hypothetical protein KDC38_12675 [Planctomycetes bacterium]|nr:hypothetical protein [Planctomycetota bacterium]